MMMAIRAMPLKTELIWIICLWRQEGSTRYSELRAQQEPCYRLPTDSPTSMQTVKAKITFNSMFMSFLNSGCTERGQGRLYRLPCSTWRLKRWTMHIYKFAGQLPLK